MAEENKELEKMSKDYQKSTGMKVIQHGEPPAGKTEFAKDKKPQGKK